MERGDIFLSAAENMKSIVISRVVDGLLTVGEAADRLGLSERQIKRLKKGVQTKGVTALIHGNRGRKPTHAVPDAIRSQIVQLALGQYKETSCQHMSELLTEHHGISVSAKTITRILHNAKVGLRFGKKQARRRRSRDRMPQEGMLIQLDASYHQWLDGCAKFTLHGAIDDATGKILALHFRPTEDQEGYFMLLEQILGQHGSPMSIYSDRHTIFFSPKRDKLTVEEELAGVRAPESQFGRALRELGIRHIAASSPQAKGRIERLWGTLQSRLIVEMRSAGVTTLDEANSFLPSFITRFNDRFAVEPQDSALAFGDKWSSDNLSLVCCAKIERSVSNGSYFSYNGGTHQLINSKGKVVSLRPKSKVTLVVRGETVRGLYDGAVYDLKSIKKPAKQSSQPTPSVTTPRAPVQTPWRNWSLSKLQPRRNSVERYLDSERSWADYANSTQIRNRLGDE